MGRPEPQHRGTRWRELSNVLGRAGHEIHDLEVTEGNGRPLRSWHRSRRCLGRRHRRCCGRISRCHWRNCRLACWLNRWLGRGLGCWLNRWLDGCFWFQCRQCRRRRVLCLVRFGRSQRGGLIGLRDHRREIDWSRRGHWCARSGRNARAVRTRRTRAQKQHQRRHGDQNDTFLPHATHRSPRAGLSPRARSRCGSRC